MRIQPVDPSRVRKPLGAYGWVDLRIVTEGHLQRLGSQAALTYLFLCAVGNLIGVSFWGLDRVARTLGLDQDSVKSAVDKLVDGGLIARRGRVVQILPTPTTPSPANGPSCSTNPNVPPVLSVPREAPEIPLEESVIQEFIPKARAELSRFLGRHTPAQSVVLALARSMARKERPNNG